MYIARTAWKSKNGKIYTSVWIRQSYREGKKTKKRDILRLDTFSEQEIAAIELALKHKGDLTALTSIKGVSLKEGASVGALWTVYELARHLGIEKALGTDRMGKLALWQVLARVLDQGSRLSAVRLAKTHAACAVLGLERGFNENDLYGNLAWLSERQADIEKHLFSTRHEKGNPILFLYDVTSSYLEGEQNAYAAYGYNRDGKRKKKQVVVGLLCDAAGEPVSVEVFKGNTQDPKTFPSQVQKASERFGCEHVTMVGDRGMIKRVQIEALPAHFHFITAITKPQIETLLKAGVFQMNLFDETLCEVEHESMRYVLRRNPVRRDEMEHKRQEKRVSVESLLATQNSYLSKHPKARVQAAVKKMRAKIRQLVLHSWLRVTEKGRTLALETDEEALAAHIRLDGCYALKTDLEASVADKTTIYDRYKDLSEVEQAFRESKTVHLEMRPIYVRTAENTRGHVLVVMLAYLIRRALRRAWVSFDLTVEEGLDQLKTVSAMEVKFPSGASFRQIPEPRDTSLELLKALDIHLPKAIPGNTARVDTHRKLQTRR